VVLRRREVEIAHHVARGAASLYVDAVRIDMRAKARKQIQHAGYALVAGLEHLEGLLEAGRGRGDQLLQAGHGGELRRSARRRPRCRRRR
jgi:hypothetical protein